MEWADFFSHVIDPFQKCDKDKSNVLGNDELKACLKGKLNLFLDEEGPFKNIRHLADNDESIKHLMNMYDNEKLNLYDYIYLRRF